MNFREYETEAAKTDYDIQDERSGNLSYYALGLNGEAGEVAELVKKAMRDSDGVVPNAKMAKELGDVLWYLSRLAAKCGYTLEEIAELNIHKLRDRAERGVIRGSGDDR